MAASIHSSDGDIGFQIAPMVDVVFVLMLFFIACVGSQQVELNMPIKLPIHEKGTGLVPIVIEISGDGLVSMNNQTYGQPTDHILQSLRDWLRNAIETFGDKDPVIIRPSPDAKHERIMEVLDSAAAAKVKNLSFS
jgi:biopolymer transport protein ExbD